jgi:hypothetical protein
LLFLKAFTCVSSIVGYWYKHYGSMSCYISCDQTNDVFISILTIHLSPSMHLSTAGRLHDSPINYLCLTLFKHHKFRKKSGHFNPLQNCLSVWLAETFANVDQITVVTKLFRNVFWLMWVIVIDSECINWYLQHVTKDTASKYTIRLSYC